MTRVLLVGLLPEAVDYSDPALPPRKDAQKIQAGLDLGLARMTARGWQAEVCLILPDVTAGPAVEGKLAAETYDCVVIGAGVRLPPRNLLLLETVVKAAPGTLASTREAARSRSRFRGDFRDGGLRYPSAESASC